MPARFVAIVLFALLLINSANTLQATHNSTNPKVGSSRAKLLGASTAGVPGGIWADGENATTTYKVLILPCKPCTAGELGTVQITYKANPSCPSAVGADLLIGAEYSNGSIESANHQVYPRRQSYSRKLQPTCDPGPLHIMTPLSRTILFPGNTGSILDLEYHINRTNNELQAGSQFRF